MAIQVIQSGLINMTEYYGTECTLYYPGLYAGQTDLVGIHKGQDAVVDFKQTNKPKRREWIGDYCLQLAAYAMAHNMAIRVIEQGLCNVPEYYGTECTLYYPGLYAGQTDLVGVHKGQDAIIDFKQTNKPKRREWIGDYCLQLAAYAMAHNFIYKTEITKGCLLYTSPSPRDRTRSRMPSSA